jgi:uncharacterized protein YaiE (UPF0345 family)
MTMSLKKNFLLSFVSLTLCTFLLVQPAGKVVAQSAVSSGKDTLKSNIAGPLEFKGTVEELTKVIKGAIVTVYEDADGTREQMKEIKKIVTPGNGEFALKFEINKFYLITVEKEGYTTKGIDVDTDVRLARPQYSKVPIFEFRVDMVKDKDGLAFKKSVANVFYQLKRNAFDYELDYTKEEMEEEERLIREQEEKQRIAELAAQKKFEMEEAAKTLRESDDASMEQKIKAALTIGAEDRAKTTAALAEVFPLNDTLRYKKAEAIYTQLQADRKTSPKAAADINFKALFAVAQALETTVVKDAEKEQTKKNEELRTLRLEAERQKEVAMMVQQQALELEMREKIAAANLTEEQNRAKEEKEQNDKVYYAIFNSNGDRKTAVANIVKAYPKGDNYAAQKAEAIFAEYEKLRLSGVTLAKMDFKQLFNAANMAEQKAVKEEIERGDNKERVKTEAYLQKEQEIKAEQEKKTADVILQALKTAGTDNVAQLAAFVESFPKSDPFRTQKGQAMLDEYVEQKKTISKTGTANVALDFGAIFSAASVAEKQAQEEAKLAKVKEKESEQAKVERLREEARQEKIKLGEQAAKQAEQVQLAKMGDAKSKREKDVGLALEAGGGDREKTVQALVKTFPKGTELPELKANAMYDAYVRESEKIRKTGSAVAKLDFSVLFKAADEAELMALQREYEEKVAKTDVEVIAYETARIEKAKEVSQEIVQEAKQELAFAEKKYEKTSQKVEAERNERISEQSRSAEQAEKQQAMLIAQREASEKEKEGQVLAKLEADRKARISKEQAEKDALAAAKLEQQRKEEAAAKAEAERMFALAEKERQLASAEQRRAEEERRKEEEKRRAAEDLAKAEADRLAAKAATEREKEEARRKATEEASKAQADQLAAKAAEERRKEEARLKAEAEAAKLQSDQLIAQAEQARIKEDQRKAAESERARIAAEQAAAKAEAERKRQEELAAAAAAKDAAEKKRQEELAASAAAKVAAEKKRQEELAAAAAAKDAAEKKRQEELAAAAAAKDAAEKKRQEELASAAAAAKEAAEKKRQEELAATAAKAEAEKKLQEEQAAAAAAAKAEAERKRLEELAAAAAAKEAAEKKRQEELAAAAEAKRKEDEAIRLAAEQKRKRDLEISGLLAEAKKQSDARKFDASADAYRSVLKLDPANKEAESGLSSAESALKAIAKADAEKRAMDEKYDGLLTAGERELAAGKLMDARKLFSEAASLKPTDQKAKDGIAEVKKREDQLAKEQAELAQMERQYVLLTQEGARALTANNLALAKQKYSEASRLKPQEKEPKDKLDQIASAEQELAMQAEEKRKREEDAKRKFEDQQRASESARAEAIKQADAARQKDVATVPVVSEKQRIEEFDRIKANVEKLNLNAEEQRKAFLSELSKIYPRGVTEELVEAKNYRILRHVINQDGIVTVYEQRTWDWGGVFWFKNGDVNITESLYKLELSKIGK